MKINFKHLFLLILILVAAFLVRFYDLETSSFEGHILRDIEIAENIAYEHEIRLVGATHKVSEDSGQQSLGPLYYYMLAAPLLFAKDSINNPIIIISIIALLNVFAVFLLYKLGKDFFSEKVGLIAAVLLALSPWDILYSRFITTPNFLLFFIIILMYSLLKIILNKDYKYFIPLAVAGALSLHFHLSVLFLVPVVGAILILSNVEFKPKYILACIVIFALALTPMLYYNITNDSLSSLNFLSERFSEDFSRSEAALESFGIPVLISTNYLGKYWFGNTNIFSFSTAFNFLQENGGTSAAFGIGYKAKMEVVNYITISSPDKDTPIYFLDYSKRDFLYLFNKLGYTNLNGITLEEFEKQTEGFLIVDRYSMFGYAEQKLTKEQNEFLDKSDKVTIKNIEIVSAPGEI